VRHQKHQLDLPSRVSNLPPLYSCAEFEYGEAGRISVYPAAAVRFDVIVPAGEVGVPVLAVSGVVLGQGVRQGNDLPFQGPLGVYAGGVFEG
jgi:hypothetical protein